jgi:signal transduction histidine kinase
MAPDLNQERPEFLSTVPATRGDRRLALAVVLVSLILFIAAVPFAKLPLAQVWAFIPIYESALVINDVITAVLLFGLLGFARSRALLVLAGGYLFTAFLATAHALTFPGLFAQGGLLGAGPQSTAWLYMFWHGGFPLFVIAYALLKDEPGENPAWRGRVGISILSCVVALLAAACGLALLATAGQTLLPAIMQGNHYTTAMSIVVAGVWAASLGALIVLWRKRPHTVLDVWLMVVMCAWLFDIALSAVLNAGRFDLGFYAGRLYGLAAGSLVLMVMLIEHGMLYRRLVGEHRRAQQKTAELMAAYKELDTFSYSVSHDLRAPLRAMDGYSQMLEEDFGARLDEEGRRLLGVIRSSSLHMGQLIDDLLAFSKLGRQEPAKHPVDMAALAHEVVEEVARGVSADIEVQALPPAQADRSLLRQVWTNLVGNALKYSGKRADPRIEIGGREGAQENVYWVRDNGAGFDMRYVDKLFGVFQRLHRAEDFPGTGVGLAIVQRVVARHGGRVWAEGQPGQGACFHFSLPKAG